MAESPRAIRYRTRLSAQARAANSWPPSPPPSPTPSRPRSPCDSSNNLHDKLPNAPYRIFSHFHRQIHIPWPLDWLTDTSGFAIKRSIGHSSIRHGPRIPVFLYGISLQRLTRRDRSISPARVQFRTSPDEVRYRTTDGSPQSSRTSSTLEPVDHSFDNPPLNLNTTTITTTTHTPHILFHTPNTLRRRRHYIISYAHLRLSRRKLHLLHTLLLTSHILYRIALTLLRQRLFATHFLPLIDATYLTFYKRQFVCAATQLLPFGTGWYQFVTGTLLQFAVYHVSQERWEIRDFLAHWPSWALVCVDLALWCMPGVRVGRAWEALGLGVSVAWTLAKWGYVAAKGGGYI